MRRMFVAAGAVAAICALAGCGKLGDLERPGPMFGQATNTGQAAPRQDPNRPVRTVDPRDPNVTPGENQPDPLAPPPRP